MGLKSNTRLINFNLWVAFQVSAIQLLFSFTSATSKNLSALFILGDSMVDVGNNYYIFTIAKAQYPNGIDFNVHPSGRFSNARTIADTIAQSLGLSYPLPYLAPNTTGDVILKGVNYASSGSGIQDLTGLIWLGFVNFRTQIQYYEKTRRDIISRLGLRAAGRLLREKSMFLVGTGSNDLGVSFFIKDLTAREQYMDSVISIFKSYLAQLYDLDARKIAVFNVGQTGCIPLLRDYSSSVAGCVTQTNEVVQIWNHKLEEMLADLTASLEGSTYVYINHYAAMHDIIQNHKAYGFENADSACCHTNGTHGGLKPCFPGSKVCPDRSKYAFWDTFHLSDRANEISARHFADGGREFTSPINLRELVNS